MQTLEELSVQLANRIMWQGVCGLFGVGAASYDLLMEVNATLESWHLLSSAVGNGLLVTKKFKK